jgi:hypothetical protein
MVPEVPPQRDDDAFAGRAPERAAPSPRGAQPGDAPASPASGPTSETGRHREEGKEGSRETLGPDGFPETETLAAQQLTSPSSVSVGEDADISFDPSQFDGQGESSNTSCPKPITGSEDGLYVGFRVTFPKFEKLSERLDTAQAGATKDRPGDDEIQFGLLRYVVSSRGAPQGGKGSVYMRWKLAAGNGLVVLVMNRGEAHRTMPNVTVRASSLLLMRFGFERVWDLMQYCVEAMGGDIIGNKLSRVDPCVDLPGTEISEFAECFKNNWVVSRSRKRRKLGKPEFVEEYLNGTDYETFYVGRTPLLCRVYDKLAESRWDILKRAVLEASRWNGVPECATRVEFQLGRPTLTRFGIDSVEDWIAKRSDIIEELTGNWLRLTAGPVDRKHAKRTPMHPVWEKTREAFVAWCGEATGQNLFPLPTLAINSSRQFATVIGILCGMFARIGKDIDGNERFFREVECALRDGAGDRNLAEEIRRKALELGVVGIHDDF